MTKKEIVKQISERLGLTQLKTKEIVQKTFDAIIDTLLRRERVIMAGETEPTLVGRAS